MLYGDEQTNYNFTIRGTHVDSFLTDAFSLSIRRVVDGFTYLQEITQLIADLDGFQTITQSKFDTSRFITLIFEFIRDTKIERVRIFGSYMTSFVITVEDQFRNDNNDRVSIACNKSPKLEIKPHPNRTPLMSDIVEVLQDWVMIRRPSESAIKWDETKEL